MSPQISRSDASRSAWSAECEARGASASRGDQADELMNAVRTHYDWIIVDTPPVMAVADATLVAHLATEVLFVVSADMTSRHAAKRALDQLEHVHAKFVGGVLNKVDLQRNPYYYSQYYRREYAQYYVNAS